MTGDELAKWHELPLEIWPVEVLRAEVEHLQSANAALRKTLRRMLDARLALYRDNQIWWNPDEEGVVKDARRLLAE